jgi:NTE family protein
MNRLLTAHAACALALAACAQFPENPPLAPIDPEHAGGYRFANLAGGDPARSPDETFVVVTFSGGGTRAAAFAYGALLALRDADIGGGRRLLDELDVISSVSGGSFAAAYYGLFGPDAFFAEFPDAVLYRPMASDLVKKLLAPWNWPRLLSPGYSRADLASEYYDEEIFQRKTYASMPLRRPFIVLNATDISRGVQLSFTQEHFDRLCSDLSGVPVARGVTASSAFPIAFPPLTVRNRPKTDCGYTTPIWVEMAEQEDFDVAPARWALARSWREYEDAASRPYLHLSDGGIADNIGLRIAQASLDAGDSLGIFASANDRVLKRLVVIVVDAKPRGEPEADLRAKPPGVAQVLEAAATRPMENYSADTVDLVRLWFQEWERASSDWAALRARCDAKPGAAAARCRQELGVDGDAPPDPELFLMHVRFDAISDPEARKRLQSISTDLQLPREQVEELAAWAQHLLLESPRFQQLVEDLRAGNGG